MRKRYIILAILATFTLLVPVAIVSQAQKPPQTTAQAPEQAIPLNADRIFALVNNERTKAGLQPLVSDPRLVATAQAKADEMVRLDYFAHNNPATGKNSAWDNPIFNQLCMTSSENISSMDNPSGDNNIDAVQGWMGSQPHHDAILRPDYTLTGLAVSGNKVVQHFCVSK